MGNNSYYKYITILQGTTTLLALAWIACIIGATIYGASNGAISVDYTPYSPLLVACASVGGVYSISVILGIACRWY